MGEYIFSLKQARTYRGLSRAEVAKSLRISPQTLVNWEKGTVPITGQAFKELSAMYGIPEKDIFLPKITK